MNHTGDFSMKADLPAGMSSEAAATKNCGKSDAK